MVRKPTPGFSVCPCQECGFLEHLFYHLILPLLTTSLELIPNQSFHMMRYYCNAIEPRAETSATPHFMTRATFSRSAINLLESMKKIRNNMCFIPVSSYILYSYFSCKLTRRSVVLVI